MGARIKSGRARGVAALFLFDLFLSFLNRWRSVSGIGLVLWVYVPRSGGGTQEEVARLTMNGTKGADDFEELDAAVCAGGGVCAAVVADGLS